MGYRSQEICEVGMIRRINTGKIVLIKWLNKEGKSKGEKSS